MSCVWYQCTYCTQYAPVLGTRTIIHLTTVLTVLKNACRNWFDRLALYSCNVTGPVKQPLKTRFFFLEVSVSVTSALQMEILLYVATVRGTTPEHTGLSWLVMITWSIFEGYSTVVPRIMQASGKSYTGNKRILGLFPTFDVWNYVPNEECLYNRVRNSLFKRYPILQ